MSACACPTMAWGCRPTRARISSSPSSPPRNSAKGPDSVSRRCRAACALVAQHPERIDLLLSDVVMPEMNGPALAQRLVGERPSLRVLFISGYADILATPHAGNSPNIDFLSKPFQASVLSEKVRSML